MITETFDNASKAIITPVQTIPQEVIDLGHKANIRVIIMTFSYRLINALIEDGLIEVIDERIQVGSAAGHSPAYRIRNTDVGVVLTGIGAPLATAIAEELRVVFGCNKFIVFGSCGALTDLPEGKIILPDEAYRDEGTSYHYAPAADFIKIRNADRLAEIMDELEIGYVLGKTWTTDAFYRETVNNKEKRVEQGCICVEMECSRLQAMCDFYGAQLYQFVYAADSLDTDWSRRILGIMEMDSRLKYFYVAWEIAKRI